MPVIASPTGSRNPDGFDPAAMAPWLTVVMGGDGREHVVLSDGWHRIRIDLLAGTVTAGHPVVFDFQLRGIAGVVAKLPPLARLVALCRRRRFVQSLFPEDRRIARWIDLLRVHDALAAGASQREIAAALYGAERVAREWAGRSDSLRSRVRRMVRDARAMAAGGYRSLLSR